MLGSYAGATAAGFLPSEKSLWRFLSMGSVKHADAEGGGWSKPALPVLPFQST